MHARLRSKAIGSALLVAFALAGCGGSSSTSQSTTTPAASATQTSSTASATTTSSTSTTSSEKTPSFDLRLASSVKLDPMPARYTCDGANVSPPITWSHVPPNTAEIDLFLFNLAPVHGKLYADWAVAGLSPKLRGLAAGQLPRGAILGRDSSGPIGYSICPAKGPKVRYAFLMYALPRKIPAKRGFEPDALREETLHVAESAGLLLTTYTRR